MLNEIAKFLGATVITNNSSTVMNVISGYEYEFVQYADYVSMVISYKGTAITTELFSDLSSALDWLVHSKNEYNYY